MARHMMRAAKIYRYNADILITHIAVTSLTCNVLCCARVHRPVLLYMLGQAYLCLSGIMQYRVAAWDTAVNCRFEIPIVDLDLSRLESVAHTPV